MNMVVDEGWNFIHGTANNRMTIVGKHVPPYERYRKTLIKTIEKRIKYSE